MSRQIIEKLSANRKLFENFTSLSILQFSNYLIPFITFPYLVRVLGPSKFGLINFAAAFTAYFGLITDYGFDLSGTRQISVHRDDREKISSIFSSVLTVKISLFLISSVFFFLLLFTFPKFRSDAAVYLLSYAALPGSVIFPVWYFKGTEKMKYLTVFNLAVKIMVMILIFSFVRDEADYYYVVAFNSAGSVLMGVFSLVFIVRRFEVKFALPSFSDILYQLKEGWYVFVSVLSVSLYTTSNIFILGLFADSRIVGYFAAADKIRSAALSFLDAAAQSVFPHVSLLFSRSRQSGLAFVRKLLRYTSIYTFVLCLAVFIFAEDIIRIVLGEAYGPSVPVLRIVAFLPFIISLSNIAGIQTMLNLNFKKPFALIIFCAGVLNLVLSFLLVPGYFQTGTAFSVLITETLISAAFFVFLAKKNIHLFRIK